MGPYHRDEMDPIALSEVSDFVEGYDIVEMEQWRMAALFDGLVTPFIYIQENPMVACLR